jgi:hypothetical protein
VVKAGFFNPDSLKKNGMLNSFFFKWDLVSFLGKNICARPAQILVHFVRLDQAHKMH